MARSRGPPPRQMVRGVIDCGAMSHAEAPKKSPPREDAAERRTLRFAGLCWALAHAPIIPWLYWGSIRQAAGAVPPGGAWALAPSYAVSSLTLALIPFLLTAPLGRWRRLYALALPAATGLGALALAIDSTLFASVGFHINAFFFRVAVQPNALAETGLAASELARYFAQGALFLAVDVTLGRALLRRISTSGRLAGRRALGLVLLLLALGLTERAYIATLNFLGGPSFCAASDVLPLQLPLRMNGLLVQLTGRPSALGSGTLHSSEAEFAALPGRLEPSQIVFDKRPDVLFVLSESMRADYLTPETMPALYARRESGTWFTRHYSTGCGTYHGVFGALFGIQGTKADAAIGAGLSPLLFSAMKANGYRVRILTASGVDWMGLQQGAFKEVSSELTTFLEGEGSARDEAMLSAARQEIGEADPATPLFTLLFFTGTHFNYSFPERSARATPFWDGKGGIRSPNLDRSLLQRRAQNAATEVDTKLAEFLSWYGEKRGRLPLTLFTGDHGEAFGEKGRIGHGSDVDAEQTHVPMLLFGDGVPASGAIDSVTSHVDLVPTLFSLLGDSHAPSSYSDGMSLFDAPKERFVLATVGWEPRYAAIGPRFKVHFSSLGMRITGLDDRPLEGGDALFAASSSEILKLFRRPTNRAASQ